jgi:hypothetical protein
MTRNRHAVIVCTAGIVLAALSGCSGGGGGGSSSATPLPPPAVSLAGVWTYTDSQKNVVHLVALPTTFQFRSLDSNMLESSGTFTLNGTTLGGSITIFPTPALLAIGYPLQKGTITGTGSATAINDTVTVSLGSVTENLTPETASNVAVQTADLAGTYTGDAATTSSGAGGSLTVAADGTFSGTDPGRTFTGAFVQVSAGTNAFTATVTFTAGTATSSYSGLAYLQKGGTSPVLVLMTDNGSGEYAGAFTKAP